MKALKKISNFTGLEDVERWIDRFELAVEVDELADKEGRILPMHLSDAAYDTWKNLPTEDKYKAEAIKTALRNAFGLRRADAWKQALTMRAVAGDSLDVIAESIRKLVNVASAGGDPIDYVHGLILLDSLPKSVRDQVVLHLGENLTFDEVLTAAKKIWPNKPELSACVGATKNESTKQRSVRCFGCDRLGHMRQECRVVCFRCGRKGHIMSRCTAVPLNANLGVTSQTVAPRQLNDVMQRPQPEHQEDSHM